MVSIMDANDMRSEREKRKKGRLWIEKKNEV